LTWGDFDILAIAIGVTSVVAPSMSRYILGSTHFGGDQSPGWLPQQNSPGIRFQV